MSVTLQQLRFLVALADELSFSRAAERCHVAQPTLSAGLRALEAGLGVQLVERSRRHVMMTEVGAEIAERGRALILGADEIEGVASAHRRPDAGTLRLGAIPTVGPYLLPRALPRLRARFAELRLFLREELTESLLDGVAQGRLDLALIALPFDVGGLHCVELFDDGYHLVTPAGAPGPPALDGARLLLLERGHCLQRHALRAFPEAGLAPDESFAATSLGTLTAMVSEGLGITLLPDLAVSGGVASESAVALTRLPEACPRTIAVVWRPTSPRADVFRMITETLRESRPES